MSSLTALDMLLVWKIVRVHLPREFFVEGSEAVTLSAAVTAFPRMVLDAPSLNLRSFHFRALSSEPLSARRYSFDLKQN